ncbi:MAG: hypothetical protein PQJ46_11025, partial [Spirochaetales bacterium]|nr:hypothetical protein [Spirochaetales bacterium]
ISSEGKLLSFPVSFLSGKSTPSAEDENLLSIEKLSEDKTYGISKGNDQDFLIWESTSSDGVSIKIIDGESNKTRTLTVLKTPLVCAKYHDGKILTLDTNGKCSIIDYNTGKTTFSYTAYGIRDVDFIDNDNIIAGRSSSATISSPLLHINTKTEETVPIDDSDILIFGLKYDEIGKKLYTLGFEERNGLMRTILKQRTGKHFEKITTIISYPGEDITSSFVSDPNSSKIFTSIAHSGINMIYWRGLTSLSKTFSIPEALKLNGDILVTQNRDSSFTIYNQLNGKKIMDFFVFEDLSYAAFLGDNKIYCSPGAEKYINIFNGSTNSELNKDGFNISKLANKNQ